jgi:GAF domain-containing protein
MSENLSALSHIDHETWTFDGFLETLADRLRASAAPDIGPVIVRALPRLCSFLNADRVALWETGPGSRPGIWVSHVHQSVDAPRLPDREDISRLVPWIAEQVLRRCVVVLPSAEDLPESAERDRATLAAQGTGAAMVAPLVTPRGIVGGLSVAAFGGPRQWSDEAVAHMVQAARVLGPAIARRRDALQIHH